MAIRYVAFIHPPQDGSIQWVVNFLDFPACSSAGDSFENAYFNAAEALAEHIVSLRAGGRTVTAPSSYGQIVTSEAYAEAAREGAKVVVVKLVETAALKQRINVMIDRSVLRRVDDAARAEGLSRSAILERAAAKLAS